MYTYVDRCGILNLTVRKELVEVSINHKYVRKELVEVPIKKYELKCDMSTEKGICYAYHLQKMIINPSMLRCSFYVHISCCVINWYLRVTFEHAYIGSENMWL